MDTDGGGIATTYSSANDHSIVVESANISAKIAQIINADISSSSVAGPSKTILSIERMSPASVDSGFDSSFPSSPDCSLDSPISAMGAANSEMSKFYKTSKMKQRNRAATAKTIRIVNDASGTAASSQYSRPSCSSSPVVISRTSSCVSALSTFSSNSLISVGNKTVEEICVDGSLLEKSALLTSLASSSVSLPASDNQDLEVLSVSTSSGTFAEPLPECSMIPSSSIKSSSVVSLPKLRVRCYWMTCTERFGCDNDLYDHVVKAHLEPLRPPADSNGIVSSSGSNSNNSTNASGSNSGLQSSPKSRLKNLICQWGNCKMGLIRGDIQKQFNWLEEHFTTRHAGKAQPYMCLIEGCSSRFTLKRLLEEHLRTGHEKAKAKRPHHEEGEPIRTKSCYQWTPVPYYIPSEKNDFLDRATEEWIVMRLRQYERTNNACFIPREPAAPRGGAAYRKRRRLLTFAIKPRKLVPKVVSNTMELKDAKALLKNAFISSANCSKSPLETTSSTN